MLHQERSGSTVRCDSLARIKAQDEEFEVRIRALEGWRAEKDNLFMRSIVTGGAGSGLKPCGNVGTAPRRHHHR